MNGSTSRKKGLAPVGGDNARVLILGSLPGDASLAAQKYYAHPRNQFWRLVGEVIGRELTGMKYEERLETLQEAGIALWDVIDEATRPGSLDQKITGARINDIFALAARLPLLRAVAFNGKKAAKLGKDQVIQLRIDMLQLPSSSPAHTASIAVKSAAWMALSRYLPPHTSD